MNIPQWTLTACLMLPLLGAGRSDAADEEERPANETTKPATEALKIPHVKIDREKGCVDLDAKVCLREGMLELIVTTKGGKEHEACFAILAKPRHVMIGLLLIGLKPGSPGRFVAAGVGYEQVDPTGDPISVSVIYKKDGKQVERPVTDFVFNRRTKKPMADVDFVFTGSHVLKIGEKTRFAADLDGTVLSLVSFGSELLAYPAAASDSNDMIEWVVHSEAMPEDATSVVIRMRPGKKAGGKAEEGGDGNDSNSEATPARLPAEETEGTGR